MTRTSTRGFVLRAIAAGLCLGVAPAERAPAPELVPPLLFVLGDSLSDVGNAAAVANELLGGDRNVGLCNPVDVLVLERGCDDLFYRRSRVSDGPVAVEHLAAHLGLPELTPSRHVVLDRVGRGTSYAVASAKARGADVEDLDRQTDMLVVDYGPLLPSHALYVVMIGGNDAIDALQALARAPEPAVARAETIAATAAAIERAVRRLIDHGARHVIVANVPSLAALPAVRSAAASTQAPAAVLAAAAGISADINTALASALDALASEQPQSVIARFDLAAALDGALAAAAVEHRNTQDACFDSTAYRASGARSFHADCAANGAAPDFSRFAFWDGIHPTGALHAALGRALIEVYESSKGAVTPELVPRWISDRARLRARGASRPRSRARSRGLRRSSGRTARSCRRP